MGQTVGHQHHHHHSHYHKSIIHPSIHPSIRSSIHSSIHILIIIMLTKLLKQCIRKMSIAVCSLKVMPSSWRLASRTRRQNDGNLAGLDLNVCKYACNHCLEWKMITQPKEISYRQVSNIRCTLVGNKIVDHSDVVGAPPVGAAPTTSSFST